MEHPGSGEFVDSIGPGESRRVGGGVGGDSASAFRGLPEPAGGGVDGGLFIEGEQDFRPHPRGADGPGKTAPGSRDRRPSPLPSEHPGLPGFRPEAGAIPAMGERAEVRHRGGEEKGVLRGPARLGRKGRVLPRRENVPGRLRSFVSIPTSPDNAPTDFAFPKGAQSRTNAELPPSGNGAGTPDRGADQETHPTGNRHSPGPEPGLPIRPSALRGFLRRVGGSVPKKRHRPDVLPRHERVRQIRPLGGRDRRRDTDGGSGGSGEGRLRHPRKKRLGAGPDRQIPASLADGETGGLRLNAGGVAGIHKREEGGGCIGRTFPHARFF